MPGVGHDHQAPPPVPANRHHRGVVVIAEILPEGLIQITHEGELFQVAQVDLHELSQFVAECRDRFAVAAHIRERDPGHDAARTDGRIVHIAADVIRPGRHGIHPCRQTWKLDDTGRLRIPGPGFCARKTSRRWRHGILLGGLRVAAIIAQIDLVARGHPFCDDQGRICSNQRYIVVTCRAALCSCDLEVPDSETRSFTAKLPLAQAQLRELQSLVEIIPPEDERQPSRREPWIFDCEENQPS